MRRPSSALHPPPGGLSGSGAAPGGAGGACPDTEPANDEEGSAARTAARAATARRAAVVGRTAGAGRAGVAGQAVARRAASAAREDRRAAWEDRLRVWRWRAVRRGRPKGGQCCGTLRPGICIASASSCARPSSLMPLGGHTRQLSAQAEPRHALAWLQAGRQQRGQLVGCCSLHLASLLASLLVLASLLAISLVGRSRGNLGAACCECVCASMWGARAAARAHRLPYATACTILVDG
eukprot:scaffold22443_cov62-Phaeocystis_antarctica.AAC.3